MYLPQESFGERVHFNGKSEKSERIPNTCNVSIVGEHFRGKPLKQRNCPAKPKHAVVVSLLCSRL